MATPTISYTDEQRLAIDTRHISVALSAGAGCGKTFVLTERFLAHLDPDDPLHDEPLEMGQIVAITFTDLAAREMRDRVREKCYQRLRSADDGRADYWQSLLRMIDSARISTVHAFCATLLRAHAVEARVDPQFTVMEQSQAQTLLAELLDDFLRERLTQQDAEIIELSAHYGLAGLRSMLQALVGMSESIDRSDWRSQSVDAQLEAWRNFHRTKLLPSLARQVAASTAGKQVLKILRTADYSHPVMCERAGLLVAVLPTLGDPTNLTGVLNELHEAAKVQGAGGKKDWGNEDDFHAFKSAAEKLRKAIKDTLKLAEFDIDLARPAAEIGMRLLRIASEVSDRYTAAKEQLQMLDFGDLMVRAHRLLHDPANKAVLRQLQGQIKLLLVDEFQDTDPLQVELVRALAGAGIASGELFFVGDFKQSIYRFRGAQPEVFRQLQHDMPAEGRLPLSQNFRSQPAILDFVNALFEPCFAADYNPLLPSRGQVGPRPSVEFLWSHSLESDAGERPAGVEAMRRQEADWIARRLRQMLDDPQPRIYEKPKSGDAAQARRVEPGDIAILFRALSDVQYYEEALRTYGIDYYLVGGHAFYAQQEIFDVLNLLRAVASPADLISLAGVLRSPFFALSDEALFWLAQHSEGLAGGLFAGGWTLSLDEAIRQRIAFAAKTLAELRACKDRLPIAELLQRALQMTGYDAALLSEFLGERKLANLHKLIDQARPFDRAGDFGLDDYITQLSRFVASQPKEALAATHPETTDVVRLMTIHASKGLEFPVVVVPDLDRRTSATSAAVLFDAELGPLVKADDDALVGHTMLSTVGAEADAQEMTRLFYVACTRAADYLILSGCIDDYDHLKGPWTGLLDERFDLEAGELRDNPLGKFPVPLVRVTKDLPEVDRAPVPIRQPRVREEVLQKAIDHQSQPAEKLAAAARVLPADRTARRAYSFSRLSGELKRQRPADNPLIDDDPEATPRVDPLGLGSLMHDLLERLHFASPGDAQRLLEELVPKHFTEPAAAIEQARPLLDAFFQTKRFDALRAIEQQQLPMHRELEFLLAWPPEHPRRGGVYLQGFIDCLFQDGPGDWHVLDYKTNRVTPQTLAKTAEGYRMQLYVYALAVEQAFGQSPRELVLHFLRNGLEFPFAWNDAARDEVYAMVNDAIQADRNRCDA